MLIGLLPPSPRDQKYAKPGFAQMSPGLPQLCEQRHSSTKTLMPKYIYIYILYLLLFFLKKKDNLHYYIPPAFLLFVLNYVKNISWHDLFCLLFNLLTYFNS